MSRTKYAMSEAAAKRIFEAIKVEMAENWATNTHAMYQVLVKKMKAEGFRGSSEDTIAFIEHANGMDSNTPFWRNFLRGVISQLLREREADRQAIRRFMYAVGHFNQINTEFEEVIDVE